MGRDGGGGAIRRNVDRQLKEIDVDCISRIIHNPIDELRHQTCLSSAEREETGGASARGGAGKYATYRVRNKGMHILLSNSQAGPGTIVKQEQEEISRKHIQAFIPGSV